MRYTKSLNNNKRKNLNNTTKQFDNPELFREAILKTLSGKQAQK
jgi:hypothetical protein